MPPTIEIETIDYQCIDALKIKYIEKTVDFYKFLPNTQYIYIHLYGYTNLKQFAIEYISVYATTYLCEQTFSKMKYIK